MMSSPPAAWAVRAYAEDDLLGVLDTWEQATRLAHPFMSDVFIADERRNTEQIYLPNTDTWVVEGEGGDIIGFIALMGNEIGAIFVRPAFHGRGVGWALMAQARSLHAVLEVEVFEVNSLGRAFYEKCGFELLAKKTHAPTGQPLLRLSDAGRRQ